MWTGVLGYVSEVFGDELMMVVCSRGDDEEEDFMKHAPWIIRNMENKLASLCRPRDVPTKITSAVSECRAPYETKKP